MPPQKPTWVPIKRPIFQSSSNPLIVGEIFIGPVLWELYSQFYVSIVHFGTWGVQYTFFFFFCYSPNTFSPLIFFVLSHHLPLLGSLHIARSTKSGRAKWKLFFFVLSHYPFIMPKMVELKGEPVTYDCNKILNKCLSKI